MNILIGVANILFPFFMYVLTVKTKYSRSLFNYIATVALFIFTIVTATFLYQILVSGKLFTTKIHAIFLNPLFLISGSYLGVYIIYRLIVLTVKER